MNARADRKQAGVILIEVLAILTLFNIVGVAFVSYSRLRSASANRTRRLRYPRRQMPERSGHDGRAALGSPSNAGLSCWACRAR